LVYSFAGKVTRLALIVEKQRQYSTRIERRQTPYAKPIGTSDRSSVADLRNAGGSTAIERDEISEVSLE